MSESEPKVITGHTLVAVKLTGDGGEVYLRKGEAFPDNAAPGELERLTKLGAFGPPPVASLLGQGASLAKQVAPGPDTAVTTLAAPAGPGAPLLDAGLVADASLDYAVDTSTTPPTPPPPSPPPPPPPPPPKPPKK